MAFLRAGRELKGRGAGGLLRDGWLRWWWRRTIRGGIGVPGCNREDREAGGDVGGEA